MIHKNTGNDIFMNPAIGKVLENTPDMLVAVDKDGIFTAVNQSVEHILGYSADEITGRRYTDFLWPDCIESSENERLKIMDGKKVLDFVNSYRHKNGNKVYFSWSAYWSNDDQAIFGIGRDISDRSSAGELMRENEKKYRSLFEQSSDSIMITDFKGMFRDVNTSLCKMFGYTYDELMHMHISQLLDPEELKARPIRFDRLQEGEHLFNDRRMVHKDGRIIPVEANVKKLDDNSIVAIARDVRKLHEAELKIRKDEALFRGVFENSPIGISLVSIEGNWLMVNQSLCNILGYAQEELLQMSFTDVTHPDDLAAGRNGQKQLLDGSIEVYRARKRYIRKDLSWIWVSLNVSVQKDEDGKPVYFISQVENITQHKTLEEKLLETDEQLKLFVEHSPAALAMLDNDMNYLVNSRRWISDYQLKETDLTGKNHYDVFPGIPEQWKDIHRNCLAGNVAMLEEDSFIREDGSTEWLKWEIRPWHRSSGEIGGIIMFTEVITARKMNEEAIRISEERYRALVENATEALFVMDFKKGKFVNISKSAEKLYDKSREELLDCGLADLSPKYQPDGRLSSDLSIEKLGEAIVGGKPFFEWTHVDKNGRLIPCEISLVRLPSEKDILIRGSVVDISERKKNEVEKEMVRYLLNERIKELTTLYKTGQVLQDDMLSIQEALEQIVLVLPGAWQFPEITEARISFGSEAFASQNYRDSRWKQETVFSTSDGIECKVEVVYLAEKPEEAEGPFVSEERNLLNMVGEMIRIYINRRFESEALKNSEANLKSIFETTETVYGLTDDKLQIISYNHAALKFAEDEIGIMNPEDINLSTYFRSDRKEIIHEMLSSALQGKPLHYEADYIQADTSVHWYDVRINPIKNEDGKVIGLLLAMDNITARKLQEENANRQIELLKELSFITSHELRHEYVKLHGVVNLMMDIEHTDSKIKDMVNNSREIFDRLDESIVKLNDRINFSYSEEKA